MTCLGFIGNRLQATSGSDSTDMPPPPFPPPRRHASSSSSTGDSQHTSAHVTSPLPPADDKSSTADSEQGSRIDNALVQASVPCCDILCTVTTGVSPCSCRDCLPFSKYVCPRDVAAAASAAAGRTVRHCRLRSTVDIPAVRRSSSNQRKKQ